VLLPSWVLPRGDAAEVVGAALVAAAAGRGCRRVAAELDRPSATARRWLRRAPPPRQWLRVRGVEHTAALDRDLLADLRPQCTALADALQTLAAAVHATRRRLGPASLAVWPLIVVLTGGRLIAPLRGS
jgi:hypothetical protein